MTKNVGNIDKLVRLIIAVVIFIWVYTSKEMSDTTYYVAMVIALIAALTSLLNYCPLYQIFGINTCKKK